jgi:hypothetical protein
LPKVKNATSYFKNGLKNRFRAIAIRADEHFPKFVMLLYSLLSISSPFSFY